jgi:hypothetical protein
LPLIDLENNRNIFSGEVTKKYDNVEGIHGRQIKSPIEIIVIFDGSYEAYTAQRIIHGLTEAAEVSHLGSKLGVINGQSGNWMANVTGDLFQLFRDLHQSKSDCISLNHVHSATIV